MEVCGISYCDCVKQVCPVSTWSCGISCSNRWNSRWLPTAWDCQVNSSCPLHRNVSIWDDSCYKEPCLILLESLRQWLVKKKKEQDWWSKWVMFLWYPCMLHLIHGAFKLTKSWSLSVCSEDMLFSRVWRPQIRSRIWQCDPIRLINSNFYELIGVFWACARICGC